MILSFKAILYFLVPSSKVSTRSIVSIEEITSVVGIAKGTFYYHFPKKEDIFYCKLEV